MFWLTNKIPADLERCGSCWWVVCKLCQCMRVCSAARLYPFLWGRVKIPCCLCCHSPSTAFDKNKELYLWVRPDTVWAVFPGEQETKNEKKKWKKRKLCYVNLHTGTDIHTPPLNSSWGKQHSLSAAYCRERIHNNVHAGSVYSFISHIWTHSADFPGCGDDLEGFKFSMLGVCFAIKKKVVKHDHSWCYLFQSGPAPQGSFPQCWPFLIFKLRPWALVDQT